LIKKGSTLTEKDSKLVEKESTSIENQWGLNKNYREFYKKNKLVTKKIAVISYKRVTI
jgi:hypothetical protein